MGANHGTIQDQIIYHYLFHKELENFFKFGTNPLHPLNFENEIIRERKLYILDKNVIDEWKKFCQYDLFKYYFNEIKMNDNIEQYKSKLENTCDELSQTLELRNVDDYLKFKNSRNGSNKQLTKNILKLEDFDNILDEETYRNIRNNLMYNEKTDIKGIITFDKLILFYDNLYLIKFIYYDQIGEPGGQSKYELLQLTADFTQIQNGHKDKSKTEKVYYEFKKIIRKNLNTVFELFKRKNIGFLKEATITFPVRYKYENTKSEDTNNTYSTYSTYTVNYNFILRNENLRYCSLDQRIEGVNNQINNYESQINELKKQLIKEKNKNQKLEAENNKLKNLNNNLIQQYEVKIKELNNIINKKNKVIQELSSYNQKDFSITSIKPGEKIMTVNFVSMGNQNIGHYSLACKNTDLFIRLEEQLYNDYPQFKNYETYFMVNTKRIKRFKTLEENKIRNKDIINMFIVDN